MITGSLRSKIDALWLDFHSGGITNPITVIEQISYLMFMRLIDLNELREEKRATRLKKEHKGIFQEDQQHLRWSQFRHLGGGKMLVTVRDEAFPLLRSEVMENNPVGHFLKDANCLVPTGELLTKAVAAIEELPLTEGDTKGDLYEYLLGKLSTAGIAGQFRTPRHIIAAMVRILDPEPTQTVCDPACGTAGFLIGVMDYLKEKFSSPELVEEVTLENGTVAKVYPGDLLAPHRDHLQSEMFHGYDFDSTMLRIAAMNLLLHGIDSPQINYQDTLGASFIEKRPRDASDRYDLILANPPFKGTINLDSLDASLKSAVKTKKSELIFLVLILRMLNMGGKAAVVVPDGVLFGSSNAHVGVRKLLVDENQLEAVISLPSGVFKPYAGVSTAILIFAKGGRTDDVWFYDVQGDGYSLDDKRTPQPEKDDLPDLLTQWKARDSKKESDRTAKHFFIPVDEIRKNKYDLSLNRYQETHYEEESYDPPEDIIKQMRDLEKDILTDLDDLETLLKSSL